MLFVFYVFVAPPPPPDFKSNLSPIWPQLPATLIEFDQNLPQPLLKSTATLPKLFTIWKFRHRNICKQNPATKLCPRGKIKGCGTNHITVKTTELQTPLD